MVFITLALNNFSRLIYLACVALIISMPLALLSANSYSYLPIKPNYLQEWIMPIVQSNEKLYTTDKDFTYVYIGNNNNSTRWSLDMNAEKIIIIKDAAGPGSSYIIKKTSPMTFISLPVSYYEIHIPPNY
jgi:hypothetical protein